MNLEQLLFECYPRFSCLKEHHKKIKVPGNPWEARMRVGKGKFISFYGQTPIDAMEKLYKAIHVD